MNNSEFRRLATGGNEAERERNIDIRRSSISQEDMYIKLYAKEERERENEKLNKKQLH